MLCVCVCVCLCLALTVRINIALSSGAIISSGKMCAICVSFTTTTTTTKTKMKKNNSHKVSTYACFIWMRHFTQFTHGCLSNSLSIASQFTRQNQKPTWMSSLFRFCFVMSNKSKSVRKKKTPYKRTHKQCFLYSRQQCTHDPHTQILDDTKSVFSSHFKWNTYSMFLSIFFSSFFLQIVWLRRHRIASIIATSTNSGSSKSHTTTTAAKMFNKCNTNQLKKHENIRMIATKKKQSYQRLGLSSFH